MPNIVASGTSGSFGALSRLGLDAKTLVEKLVSIEKRPVEAVQRKQTGLKVKLDSFASLRAGLLAFKSALAPLQSLNTFQPKSAVSSDPQVITATATASAVRGASTVNQIVQLAKVNKLQSEAFTAGTDRVGTGTLRIKVGKAEETTILIDDAHSSLLDVRDQINSARAGVTASLLKIDENDYRLMIQANTSGAANPVTIAVTDEDGDDSDAAGLSQLRYTPDEGGAGLTETQSAQNAIFDVDSVRYSRSSNTVSDAIPGVTVTLLKETAEDANIAITVTSNPASVKNAVESFVSAYNNLARDLNKAQEFNTETQQKGPLLGDPAARRIANRLHALVTGRVSGLQGEVTSPVHFGLTSTQDGTLKIDSAVLESALLNDPLAVGRVFASEEGSTGTGAATAPSGVANQMFQYISDLFNTNTGDLAANEKSLKDAVARLESQIAVKMKRVDVFEKKTRDRFAKLEVALERLEGIRSGVSDQISQLGNLLGALQNRRK